MIRRLLDRGLRSGAMSLAILIALSSSWLAAQNQGGQGAADIVLHSGKILTVDKDFSTAEAVAIKGNKFAAVGRNQDVLQQAGPSTLKIDLKGRTVVPGLMDTHINSWVGPGSSYGSERPAGNWEFTIDWRAVATKQDVLNQMRGFMQKYRPKPGGWLFFYNRPRTPAQVKLYFDGLNRYDLDTVTPDNPVAMAPGFPSENALLVNSKAIEILWKNDEAFLKKYGRYWLGTDRKPDGHLESPATTLVLSKYEPHESPEVLAPGYRKVMIELNAQGITTISNKMRANGIEAYKILEKQSEQTVRLAYGLGMDEFGVLRDPGKDLKEFQGKIRSGDDMNWVTSVGPSATDGSGLRACSNQKRSAVVASGEKEGSSDVEFSSNQLLGSWWPVGQCLTDNEFKGGAPSRSAAITGNYYRDWIMALPKFGLRLANDHVAGDRTAANILNMVEEIQKKYGPAATKDWTFEHCALMDPKDIPRAARLGIIFSCAPYYIRDTGASIAQINGEQVANTFIVPVKSMINAGSKVAYESGTYGYVWDGLQLFIERKDRKGRVWGPQERLDQATALRTATQWSADLVLKGDKLGSIEPGKLADLVVIDKDYMTISVEEIGKIDPQLTIFDGRIVFVNANFAKEYNLRPQGAAISTFQDIKASRPEPRGGNEGLR